MRRNHEQWLVLFQQQEESALSVAEFCQLNKLSTSNYYHWRAELKASKGNVTPTFIQATIETQQREPASRIELRLTSQTLFLPTTTSPAWLADLIQKLP